ncbi:hypothetical protein [Levilactobacillus brevis]|uniref:hypothetical protein n=1 Tax=Levilactobacillus brevis TaxID=1580 RepID=UPI000B2AFF17|nr:hypothetical protein [Levilactobacillus brevis]
MAFFDWLRRMIEPTRQTRPQHNRRRATPLQNQHHQPPFLPHRIHPLSHRSV